jgi:hypothetical protein
VSKLSHDECAVDFVIRRRTRKRYPGACSLEFQNVMDIVLRCLFNWDDEEKQSLGPGIVGDLVAWNQTTEEQGRGSLHAHWQLFTEQLSTRARLDLFHTDKVTKDIARKELVDYIDSMICASYGTDIDIVHDCEAPRIPNGIGFDILDKRAKESSTPTEKFSSRSHQIFRDARHKYCRSTTNSYLTICNHCSGFIRSEDIPNDFYKLQSSKRRVSNIMNQQ